MSKVTFKHVAGIALATTVVSLTANSAPITGTVTDTYWGGNHYNVSKNKDVIGTDDNFDIDEVNWSLDGSNLTIKVKTDFALSGLGSFENYTKVDPNGDYGVGRGVAFGDLFLSSSWTPFGAVNDVEYKQDDMTNGTQWEYGFSLDNRLSSDGGAGNWYDLTECTNNSDCIYSSDDYMKSNVGYRANQAVSVNRSASAANIIQENIDWSISGSNPGEIVFSFDISGTTLEHSDTIAFHWGMTCANDVIEGSFAKPVPESGSLTLLSLGLLGLGAARMRAKK